MTTNRVASDAPLSEGRMSLRDHLAELRSRLMKCALAIVIGMLAAAFLRNNLLDLLLEPFRKAVNDPNATLVAINPTDKVTVPLKIITYLGLFFASPVWLFQLWRFITPALKKNEKRYAIPFVMASILLFIFGAWIAVVTMPQALKFFEQFGGKQIRSEYAAADYISLYLLIVVAFGVCFEFPVVLVALQLARILTSSQLLKGWRYAIVLVVIIAAVATPSQDPYSLFAMAGPMWIFYFGAIGVGKALKR